MIVEIGPGMSVNTNIVRHVSLSGNEVHYVTDEGNYEITYGSEEQAECVYANVLGRYDDPAISAGIEVTSFEFEESNLRSMTLKASETLKTTVREAIESIRE